MKLPKILLSLAGAGLFASALTAPEITTGQADSDAATVGALVHELQAQQSVLIENHARIDAKVAAIEEELRQARIYVARGGKQ